MNRKENFETARVRDVKTLVALMRKKKKNMRKRKKKYMRRGQCKKINILDSSVLDKRRGPRQQHETNNNASVYGESWLKLVQEL